ncbi:MAG TPA: hypothetical protein VJ011_03260 [Steroidobacteraceae bacterium]|nr:hypothetical protein [Steroidobacteraceae bacterium]
MSAPGRPPTRLAAAARQPGFADALDAWLDSAVVSTERYPLLADLAWNRADRIMPAREAFELYERNWRFVDVSQLDPAERRLIQRLAEAFGKGLING